MTLNKKTSTFAVSLGLLVLGSGAAGCGGDDSDRAAADSSTSSGSAEGSLEITMDDFSFAPADATTKSATVDISAPNEGATTHELVLVKSNLDPAKLPTAGDGTVDEEALDSPGEIPDVGAGETGEATVDLSPGKYVMFCNLPGHYAQGMYGSLTVK